MCHQLGYLKPALGEDFFHKNAPENPPNLQSCSWVIDDTNGSSDTKVIVNWRGNGTHVDLEGNEIELLSGEAELVAISIDDWDYSRGASSTIIFYCAITK